MVCGFMLTARPSAIRIECQHIAASEIYSNLAIKFER